MNSATHLEFIFSNTLRVYFQDRDPEFAEFRVVDCHSLLHTLIQFLDLMLL